MTTGSSTSSTSGSVSISTGDSLNDVAGSVSLHAGSSIAKKGADVSIKSGDSTQTKGLSEGGDLTLQSGSGSVGGNIDISSGKFSDMTTAIRRYISRRRGGHGRKQMMHA